MELKIIKTNHKKSKPSQSELGFGKHFTDHMFVMDYTLNKGWHDPRIIPYEPIALDPAAMIFHYGQTVFEGLKAYRTKDDRVLLFRPEQNFRRLNSSSERLSIPEFDSEEVLAYLKQLILIDKEWIPKGEGTSLYIRPFVIGTEANLSVIPSTSYKFFIILSPVGSYYQEGIKPVRIKVEEEYTRAVRGGTGAAKTAGNYSASYKAQKKAASEGYSQVLWLDAIEKKYIEEVGLMNVFFKVNGQVITPSLSGSILEGVTRKSVIELLKDWGVPVVERKIALEEIKAYYLSGELEEAFGTGTAAVVSPIGELVSDELPMVINERKIGELAQKVYDHLTGIQTGVTFDQYNWTVEVK